jgi:hypothetical protein
MPALRKDKALTLLAIRHRLNRIFWLHSAKHWSKSTLAERLPVGILARRVAFAQEDFGDCLGTNHAHHPPR